MYSIQAMLRKPIAIWVVAWSWGALADFGADNAPYQYYSRPHTLRPFFPQFESWYPHNAEFLIEASTGICNQTLRDYRNAYSAPRDSANTSHLLAICYRHEACIVDQLGTNHLLNYQSALVMLGLLPTLMASIGPSIAEISLLYAHRPLLSVLLSFSTPSIWTVSSLFEHNTPDCARVTRMDRLGPRRLGPRVAAAMSAGEYLLAAGAAANTVFTAVEIGQKTILSWGCTTQFTPLLWAVLPSVVYAIAGANYYFLVAERTSRSFCEGGPSTKAPSTLSRETTICRNRKRLLLDSKTKIPATARLLDTIVGIIGFIHYVFGLAAFSSLQFVTVSDTFGRIICPFALSTFVCRLILIAEVAGLRAMAESGE